MCSRLPEEVDPDRELEQLMLEKVSNPPASVPHVAPISEATASLTGEGGPVAMVTNRRGHHSTPHSGLTSSDHKAVTGSAIGEPSQSKAKGMLTMLAEKENAPVVTKRDSYGFTPSSASNPLATQPHDLGYVTVGHTVMFLSHNHPKSYTNTHTYTRG